MSGLFDSFFQFLMSLLTLFFYFVLAVIGLFILKKIIDKLLFQSKVKKSLSNEDKAFLLIKIPPTSEKKEDAMDEFLRSLHHVLPNNSSISLELVSNNQFLSFYIVVPKNLKNVLESQLYAQYPDAEIEEIEDYITDFGEKSAFAEVKFKNSSIYPVNTYKNQGDDFLKNLSTVLSRTEEREKVLFQLSLKRVGSKFWERNFKNFYYTIFKRKYDKEGKTLISHIKLSHDLYVGKLRIAYTGDKKNIAETKLNAITGLLKIFKGANNEFKKKNFLFKPDFENLFKSRLFENGDFWTTTELATLYHFPYKGTIVSNVVNTSSKRGPAPDILPREGSIEPKEVSFIGETNYRNEKRKFGIKRIDRRRHLYVVGKTGSGKSKLLELLLVSDIQDGHGCCLLDPHGDLAEEVLKFVPKNRIKDVVYVNPADNDFPIGFNPLEPVSDYQVRQHLSVFFISIFKKLFSENWNARMEHLIRYITLALLETPDSNILGIPRIISDIEFRQRVIKQIQDPVVKSFWTNEFSSYNEQFSNQAVIPILNKVGQFISNPIVRNMIGQKRNMLDFEDFMNSEKIVIINISKGKLGDENAALLGSMFITKIQQAALARSKIPEEERKDFYFYVDEFQNFATDAFSTILSEARKYRLNLTIAHQYIAQLPDDVKATAFGNVGSIIVFAVGGQDASYLEKEFSPVFNADDMINLNAREMYIKMSVNGKITTPFSAKTLNIPKSHSDYSLEIKDFSRMAYGRNRTSVENEIEKWTSAGESDALLKDDSDFPEPII